MAFWNKKQTDFEQTDKAISNNAGISQANLASELGVQRSTIARRLPSMEEAGYLYSEDDKGRLWPFGKRKK